MQDNIPENSKSLPKEIGIIGLGKMGSGIALQLQEKGWRVIAFNRSFAKTEEHAKHGIIPAYSIQELLKSFQNSPRVIWIMLPAGDPVEQALFGSEGLVDHLEKGDIVVDAGNSFFKDAARRTKRFEEKGIHYVDVGVSGGPSGARHGACLMIGGSKNEFDYLEPLYRDMAIEGGYAFFEGPGAGHFVKMVHNGIEYGMMQAIGEGFEVMKKSDYKLDLTEVSRIYNRGSVVESRLIGWLHQAYKDWGEELESISGTISHSGEGKWTVEAAEEMGIEVPVIKDSYQFRLDSEEKPSYTGKVVSALRGQFGGHAVKKE